MHELVTTPKPVTNEVNNIFLVISLCSTIKYCLWNIVFIWVNIHMGTLLAKAIPDNIGFPKQVSRFPRALNNSVQFNIIYTASLTDQVSVHFCAVKKSHDK